MNSARMITMVLLVSLAWLCPLKGAAARGGGGDDVLNSWNAEFLGSMSQPSVDAHGCEVRCAVPETVLHDIAGHMRVVNLHSVGLHNELSCPIKLVMRNNAGRTLSETVLDNYYGLGHGLPTAATINFPTLAGGEGCAIGFMTMQESTTSPGTLEYAGGAQFFTNLSHGEVEKLACVHVFLPPLRRPYLLFRFNDGTCVLRESR